MSDIVDKPTRSRMMGGIRGKDTRPEMTVRRALHARGFRYRLNARDLPGTPDLVFPKRRTIVFIHGCYWHRHEGCRYATVPTTNRTFWTAKFEANVARDARNIRELREKDWRIAIVWECALRRKFCGDTIAGLADFLRGDEQFLVIPNCA